MKRLRLPYLFDLDALYYLVVPDYLFAHIKGLRSGEKHNSLFY